MRFGKQAAILLAATAVLTGGTLAAGTGTASAAVPVITSSEDPDGNYIHIQIYEGSEEVDNAEWSQDPTGQDPGDAMRVEDGWTDGYYVTAYLAQDASTPAFRSVTTQGHDADYTSGWATGDLPENQWYKMWVCLAGPGGDACTGKYDVES